MEIFKPTIQDQATFSGSVDISGSLTITQNLNVVGELQGAATTASYISLANVDGFADVSSSIEQRISRQESFSQSLDDTFATDQQVADTVSSLNAATSSYALQSHISGAFASTSQSLAGRITSNESSVSALNLATSSYLLNTTDTLTGDLTVTGALTAQTLHVQEVTSSVVYSSGSNRFGEDASDVHQFTGSIRMAADSDLTIDRTLYVGHIDSGADSTLAINAQSGFGIIDLGSTYTQTSRLRVNYIDSGAGTGSLRIANDGNVGINATTPLDKLTVGLGESQFIAAQNASSNITGSNVWGFGLYEGSTRGGEVSLVRDGTNNQMYVGPTVSGQTLRLGYGAKSTGIFIASDGNVGIDTISTTGTYSKLTVNGSISLLDDQNTKLEIGRYSAGASNSYIKLGANSNSLRITNNTDTADLLYIENGGNVELRTVNAQLRFQNSVGPAPFIANTGTGDQALYFSAGGSERMRIDSSGYIGLGNLGQGASVPLHIYQDSADVNGNNDVMLVLQNTRYGSTDTSDTYENKLVFGWANHYAAGISGYKQATNITGLKFYTEFGYNVDEERMRITGAGNVGINETNPTAKLHITSGDADWSAKIKNYTANAYGLSIDLSGASGNNFALATYTPTGTGFFVKAGGNVGIGTTDPAGKLEVRYDTTANNQNYIFSTSRTGANSSYNATGLHINAVPTNNTGDTGISYLSLESRYKYLNGNHGTSAFITNTPGTGTSFGDGQIDFFIRNNNAPYTFKNDPSTSNTYWMDPVMTVRSDGAVLKPNQPGFSVFLENSTTTNSDLIFTGVYYNTGNHYSTSSGRFTAPVAGTYFFYWGSILRTTSGTYRLKLHRNGSAYGWPNTNGNIELRGQVAASTSYETNASRVFIHYLNAYDYVQVALTTSPSSVGVYGDEWTYFGGYLLN